MSNREQTRATPTIQQKAALRGTTGNPTAENRYVTDADPRNTNRRVPTAHHTSHEPEGDDVIQWFPVLTHDPPALSPQTSPPTDGVWFVRSGTSPESVSLRANLDGEISTVDFGGGSAAAPDYLQYREEQAQNTSGGTFTAGAWRTRTINIEVSDIGGHGTLSGNQITLATGTYLIRAHAPAFAVNRHQLRLQNVTDATTVLVGSTEYAAINTQSSQSSALLEGVFTIAASKALELQHQCQTTAATYGFGVEANFTTEVYSVVELWKIG